MISTRAQLVEAMKTAQRVPLQKAAINSQLANGMSSMWRATGNPGQGAIPTAAALCTSATAGGLTFTNPSAGLTTYIADVSLGWIGAYALELHDRLAHMGGLSGIATTAQTVNIDLSTIGVSADRLGDADYSDVQWWLEWYTATGATAVTASLAVTYNDNSTDTVSVSLAATMGACRCLPIYAAAGKSIKSVQNLTNSATTGTAGNFGVTATRQRAALEPDLSGWCDMSYEKTGFPQIADNACLFPMVITNGTTTGAGGGILYFVQG